MMETADRLRDSLERYVSAEGVELDDFELVGQGPRRVVRVTVDADGGIDLDRIASLSRGLERVLDDGLVDGPYTLEVSSPGLERKLRQPAHYRKSVGREVQIKTTEPIDDATSHRGVLSGVGEESFVVSVDGVDRTVPFDAVAKARTVYRWEKAPKPGKQPGKQPGKRGAA